MYQSRPFESHAPPPGAAKPPGIGAWIDAWLKLDEGYAVLAPPHYERLAADGLPMRVLARDSRRVIVSRK